MTSSEGEKCGLSSILPVSCRGKAESFARTLHCKLRSLGSQDDNESADESSWLAANENPVAISQPRHMPDTEVYLDFGLLESPESPEEELEEIELRRLINNDSLQPTPSEICHCPIVITNGKHFLKPLTYASNDSDSDGPFYDTENYLDDRLTKNCDVNSRSSKILEETGTDINSQDISSNQEELFTTTSDCTPQPSISLTEGFSTYSLKDEDSSLATNGSLTDISRCVSDSSDNLYAKCNGDIDLDVSSNDIVQCSENVKESNNDIEIYSADVKELKLSLNIDVDIGSIDNGKQAHLSLNSDVEIYVSHLNADNDLPLERVDINKLRAISAVNHNGVNGNDNSEDDLDEEDIIPRVRRCSSLKTGKTPPGTPSRKKIVRFADALGLDLADVRTFLDEIPKVPISAYEDLSVDLSESSSDNNLINAMNSFHGIRPDKYLMPLFQQPSGQPNFLELVKEYQVCLENAVVDDPVLLSLKGTVRVRNLDFHKSVHVRYSLDSWKTFADVQATYLENSCDGFSDTFSFLLYAHTLSIGQRLEFACRFQCKGIQYWDNNKGANYCFQCLPATNHPPIAPITNVDDWEPVSTNRIDRTWRNIKRMRN